MTKSNNSSVIFKYNIIFIEYIISSTYIKKVNILNNLYFDHKKNKSINGYIILNKNTKK